MARADPGDADAPDREIPQMPIGQRARRQKLTKLEGRSDRDREKTSDR
ncbi:hypothetical protein [Halorhabdus rudnickae]|nr:hypothetical protein [Halorhabdus rudnickae]